MGTNFWKEMRFEISQEEQAKIDEWLRTVIYPPIVEQQRQNPDIAKWLVTDEDGVTYPYGGAIGGGLTYEFTPTSIGMIIKVRWHDGQELDLTDYESW